MFSKEFRDNWKSPPTHSNAGKRHKLRRPDPRATEAVNRYRERRIEVARIAGTYPFPASKEVVRQLRKNYKK